MFRKLLRAVSALGIVVAVVVTSAVVVPAVSTPGLSQPRLPTIRRPPTIQRPPWKDVCCGGPCCVRPRPGR